MQKRKHWGGAILFLAALLLICSCDNSGSSIPTVSVNVPSGLHGTWQNPEDSSDILVIYANDILSDGQSLVQTYQAFIDTNYQEAEDRGYSFSANFYDTSQTNYYSFTLSMTVSNSSMSTTMMIITSLTLDESTDTLTLKMDLYADGVKVDESSATADYTRIS